jgi:hypothetical protein
LSWTRRRWLAQAAGGAALSSLAACEGGQERMAALEGGWIEDDHVLGHRLRPGQALSMPATATSPPRRAQVLVLGAGVAGLSAARG